MGHYLSSSPCWRSSCLALLPAMLAATAAPGCSRDDSDAAACTEGEVVCSEDGTELRTCMAGSWQIRRCMADEMKLCEDGECVAPWRYGSPTWSACDQEPRATAETLAQKAEGYEQLARRLHVHPELKWMMGVQLPCQPIECAPGQQPPCTDCSRPAVDEHLATHEDVEAWQSGENDGLWSALYLASQAYRFAATRDPQALSMLKMLLQGQATRMGVTGVAGLYTRQLVPPGIKGLACPSDLSRYIPDEEKDDNRWVRVGDDGCVQTVDPSTMQFVSSDHCGLEQYKGTCWLDNVSIDEYSGHMFAHAAVAGLVDDAEVREMNASLLRSVGRHLVDNQLELIDWDGRRTEHGKIWAGNVLSGFMSAMSWAFMKAVAEGTGDPEFTQWVDECVVMQSDAGLTCMEGKAGAASKPYDELIGISGVYLGCMSNWNNFSMHMLSLQSLLLLERDPRLRSAVQDALEQDMFAPPGEERPLEEQHNAFFDFIYASGKHLGPGTDGPAFEAVEDAICMLRQFPASQHEHAVACPADKCVPVCEDRFGDPMTDYPREVADRCVETFLWWKSPYETDGCEENQRSIKPPAGFLLPYWMGRYYGFIDEAM